MVYSATLATPKSVFHSALAIGSGPNTVTTRNRLFLAPMAGVTDRPFRQLCQRFGAGYAVSEMVTSDPKLWASGKTARRVNHDGEAAPIAVQLTGADPERLAQAARHNVALGAQVIDLNMGCPAKKVCQVACGSALLKDEALVARIFDAVVAAVSVPVTLKLRTGWDPSTRNAVAIARRAQSAGVQMITVHGRTRACGFVGPVEYATIAAVKAAVTIPVVANGDLDHPQKIQAVLALTGVDAVMIGRAAQGQPWIFADLLHFFAHGRRADAPRVDDVAHALAEHLEQHYRLYGEHLGLLTARKHIIWYLRRLHGGRAFCDFMNQLQNTAAQARAVAHFLRDHEQRFERLCYVEGTSTSPVATALTH